MSALRLAVHAVAGVTLLFALRSIRVARGWIRIPALEPHAASTLPNVSIIVPARDEARSIERCVRSLLAQTGVDHEVIVVDDRSTDATPQILATLAAEDARLRVVRGAPLPGGWIGKPWACAQGAAIAHAPWLLFTDADSVHAAAAAHSTIAFAADVGADALTIMTGQELGTFAERAVLPSILGMVVFASGPLDVLNDPKRPDRALANGQFLLVRRVAYDALGGHAALRDCIVEDLEFARRLKSDGRFRLVLADATHLVSVRMYHSLREIWDGFTKNAYLGAKGDMRAVALGAAFCLALSVAPPVLAGVALARGRRTVALEAVLAFGLVLVTGVRGARQIGMSPALGLLSPLGLAVFAGIALNSARRGLTGAGFAWRGRTYGAR